MYRGDDRAQSIQIGAVILFGALILALSSYQAFVVPQQNEGVEVSHSQQVQNELGDLRNAVVSVPGDRAAQSVSITLGTRYPDRIVAMNPPPVSGSLRTQGTADGAVELGIDNATAAGGAGDVWNGSERTYSTGAVRYRPGYHEYGSPPTTMYENSVLYNDFESGTVTLSGQTLVDDRTITLVALNGSLSETRTGSTAVDVRPTSASTTTLSVENESADQPVTVRAPTRLDESTWRDLLGAENASRGGFVRNVTVVDRPSSSTFDTLRLTMAPNETYDLRLAKAGLGNGVTDEGEHYVTAVAGNGSSVPEEGTTGIAVQVRDAYNNPVSGSEVTAETDLGALADRSVTTGADGRATFTYEAPTVTTESVAAVNVSYAVDPAATPGFARERPENVRLNVRVQNTQVDGSGGGNASAPFELEWANPATANYTYDVGLLGDTRDLDALLDTDEVGFDNATVDGATVDFAVNNRSVASVAPSSDETNVGGIASTTMTARANGTVRIYAVSGGASDVVNVTVTNVTAGEPIADFTYTPADPTTADTVQFTDESDDDGTIVSREWDVDGDGTVEYTGASPTHDYASPGTYDVELNVTDDEGNDDTVERQVTVGDGTAPSISGFDATNPSGMNVQVSFESDEDLSAISVDLTDGDGDAVTTLDESDFSGSGSGTYTATYTVSSPGTYTATLRTAADADGNDGANGQTATVTINDPNAIQFDNFQGFTAETTANEFRLDQINVQDSDGDDDLDRVEYEVTDGGGTVVATETVTNVGPAQYQAQQPAIVVSGTVQAGESYSLTGTVYDADGNHDSRSLVTTAPTPAAQQVTSNGDASRFSSDAGVQFSVGNTGQTSVTIETVTVSVDSEPPGILHEQNGGSGQGQHEIHVSSPSASGHHEAGDGGSAEYSLGTSVSLTDPVDLDADEDATLTMLNFKEVGPGNSGGTVDMGGRVVDVTLAFADGSSKTYAVNVPD